MAKRRRPLFDRLEDRLCMAAPALQTTFQLPQDGPWTPTVYRASPLLVDIFGTGKDDIIAVAAGARLVAYASNADGSASPIITYQVPNGVADIKSTPIVVTDPSTGKKDLFAAMGRDETSNNPALEDGRVFGWDLRTGQLLPAFANGVSTGRNVNGQSGVYGALTSGALEGNGSVDIVATSFSHNVTAIRLDGSVLWQWTNDDTILSGAVVGDLDRDGHQEVVVGGDSSNNGFFQAGGWVNVLTDTGSLKYRKFIPGEVTWSSPILADLNNNGFLDIVIGTGLNYDVSTPSAAVRTAGNNIYAFDPFGNILPGWPYHTTSNDTQAHQVLAGLAAADLTGNGQLDVVAVDRSGFVHAIQPNGQPLPGFVGGKSIAPTFAPGSLPDDYASPIIADVLGQGSPQIVASYGPFLAAFDKNGNETMIATTAQAPNGPTNEGIDTASAVGHFNGGTGYTLAYVSYNPFLQNRPDQVQVFKLSPTTVAPPWPEIRRTSAGDAVERSATFDRSYVASAFFAALNFLPDQGTLDGFQALLDSDTLNLFSLAETINTGMLARQVEVQRVFQGLLGHPADQAGLSAYTAYLATHTYRDLSIAIAGTAEFAQHSNNDPATEVRTLVQFLLGRPATAAEVTFLTGANLPPAQLATALVYGEGVSDQLAIVYANSFGAGAQNGITPDSAAVYAFDIGHGAREEDVNARIIASGGNYAATNILAGYVRDLYRDLLKRDASSADVAVWLNAISNGTVGLLTLPTIFQNSLEARVNYLNQEFQALLGRSVDPGSVNSLAGYTNREAVVLTIVGSPEYFQKNGSTNPSYVQALFRDLAGITIDAGNLNNFVSFLNNGLPRVAVAQQIIYGGPLYFYNTIVNEIMQYLPDETQGVLRSGNQPPTAAGQPINPNPILISYLQGFQALGFTDEQIIGVLTTAPQYFSRISYFKGLLRSPGIRN